MFKTTALNSVANAYVDKDDSTSTPGTRLEADDRNIIQDEMVNAVERSGQTLSAGGTIDDQLAQAFVLNQVSRSIFAYVSTTQISIAGGAYFHYGTVNQVLKIDSTITHTITTPGTSQWMYFYIDDSAVASAGLNVLTGTEIINSTTAPTYSVVKKGWYNGDDLCIFGVYINSSGHAEAFYHDGGDYLSHDYSDVAFSDALSTTWEDADLSEKIPGFSTKAFVTFVGSDIDGNSNTQLWRTKGSSGSGKYISQIASGKTEPVANTPIVTDTNQTIEVKNYATSSDRITVYVSGWYFPAGM